MISVHIFLADIETWVQFPDNDNFTVIGTPGTLEFAIGRGVVSGVFCIGKNNYAYPVANHVPR